MKRYRRLIIIFMLVIINVLVIKSAQIIIEENPQDQFINAVTNKPFQIRYKMAVDHYHNGIQYFQKARSKKLMITRFIYPQKQKHYYDQAIRSMMCALTAFLECVNDFSRISNVIAKQKKYEKMAMIPAFNLRGSLILEQTFDIASEVIDLLNARKKLGGVHNNLLLEKELCDLIKNMEEYDKRINTFFEKRSIPVTD